MKTKMKKICIITFLSIFPVLYGENYAVLVGIEDYQHEEDVYYAVNDAELIREMLIKVGNWNVNNIKLITDSDATKSSINDEIIWMYGQADDEDDICLFYFSGHGADNILLDEVLCTYEYYDVQGAFTRNELYGLFYSWDTDNIVIILETCHSADFNGYIEDGVLLMADAGEYNTSEELEHSPFTYFLAKGMAGYADLTSGSISAEDIFNYADDLTTSFDPSIVPVMDDDYSAGDLEFLVKDFTLSGTLSHSETWSGSSLTLSGNVTVPSGVTLTTLTPVTVGSGKTLTFASGSTVKVLNGPITQSGTGVISISVSGGATYCPMALLKDGSTVLGIYSSDQAAINAASSGDYVYLDAGSYPGSIDMKSGVDVKGAGISSTIIGVSVIFDAIDDYTALSDLRTTSVMLDDCGSYVSLSNIKASGIDIVQSGPLIEYVEILGWGTTVGIYAHNNAYAEISGGEIQGHEYGILITWVGTVVAEYIEFCENYPYDICADGGTESAETFECIWSGDPRDYTYGNVMYDVGDETCEGLKKAVLARARPASLLKSHVAVEDDQGREDYDDALSLYRLIRNNLRLDIKSGLEPEPQKYAAEYSDAIGQFRQIVEEYPESRYSVLALGFIADCYRSLGESESLAGYLGGILKDAQYESLHLYAQNLLIPYHRRTGDIQAALDLSDTILSSSPPEDLACDVLYGKGVIYQHNLGDHDRAVETYLAVVEQYPDHPIVQSALTRLEIMGESVVIPDKPATAPEPEPVEDLALEGYPNPFNPTATIRFGLPEAGRVTLVVYDLMGREVVRLAEGYRDAGWQELVWNGRDARGREVPTGIYIARLITPQGARAIKLVMMK